MAEQEITTRIEEIFVGTPLANKVLREIFGDLHPRLSDEKSTLTDIFTPEIASDFLARISDLQALLSDEDTYEETMRKFQNRIEGAEQVRDEVLGRLYEEISPLETSYRQIWLFFENSVVPDGKPRPPVEFFIFNADAAAMKDRKSVTLEAVRHFVTRRNDNFNFRDDICNLVVPGPVPMTVLEALEEVAWQWGMLLITDLADEKSFRDLVNQFRPGGRYEFLKRPDEKAVSDVIMIGYLKLRDSYWFEWQVNNDGLYAPASVTFAGALARTDRARNSIVQGPIGTKFGQLRGVEEARIECLVSQVELLSQCMQVIPIIRDADYKLCFYGCRSFADEPYGVYKFFSTYRELTFLERLFTKYLQEVAGQVLTREFLDEAIEKSIRGLLEDQKACGTITNYELFVDKSAKKLMQGICDVDLEVSLAGPEEVFRIKIDVPEFSPRQSVRRSF
jgi:hypothetical protein